MAGPLCATTLHRDGTDLHVLDTGGEGPPVLLLHGPAGSAREFEPTARALAPDCRVILVDQRGHGRSTRRPADVSHAAFVADAVAVAERVAGGPVRLVGQSLGAHTALLTAAARPDLVERLVLLEPPSADDDPERAARTGAFFASWPLPFPDRAAARAFLGPDVLSEVWVADLDEGPDGLRPRFDADVMEAVIAAAREPWWAEWERVAAPTLAVFCDLGPVAEAWKDEMIARRPATVRADLDAFYGAHLEDPAARISLLRGFLPG
ncbi:alpha/beta fold hydrolase [Nocardiopsis sp. CC223A]|uniref:alpha/beta fold hydrolase n=1 Tax=Nocardiopsis sp. CC223A TaxID=3044051 RepID=UPI00278C0332|nr:alpha/beta hydrolase [Nocardiopsis sp. CC223A]